MWRFLNLERAGQDSPMITPTLTRQTYLADGPYIHSSPVSALALVVWHGRIRSTASDALDEG